MIRFCTKSDAKRQRGRPQGLALLLAAALLSGGCATSQAPGVNDPLEPMNRGIFWFNEKLDRFLLEPIATGYDWIAPDRVQKSVGNFFRNLRFPVYLVNDLLQGKVRQAGVEIGRFGVNTTVGLVGLFDPATGWGLEGQNEDFGQTLGRWGLGPGPYLVIPILGPSSPRDLLGMPVDSALSVVPYVVDSGIWLGARGLQTINSRAGLLEEVRENREMAFDYYVFLRDAYRDYRENLVTDGEAKASDESDDLYELLEP